MAFVPIRGCLSADSDFLTADNAGVEPPLEGEAPPEPYVMFRMEGEPPREPARDIPKYIPL